MYEAPEGNTNAFFSKKNALCTNASLTHRSAMCRYSHLRGVHIRGNSWRCIEEKVIPTINHIAVIHCVNTVTNGILIWTNCSGTCERSITFAISAMRTVQISFIREYHHSCGLHVTLSMETEIIFNFSFCCTSDHNELRDHFIENHFLCQDGECTENIFSAVFRTDIDLKGEHLFSCTFLYASDFQYISISLGYFSSQSECAWSNIETGENN